MLLKKGDYQISNLIVPPGTQAAELRSVTIQTIDNGALLTRLLLINEAGKPPYQVQQTLFYQSMKEALENASN